MRTRPTLVLPANAVWPGDHLLGPDLLEPAQVLWRCDLSIRGSQRLELASGQTLLLPDADACLVVGRPPLGAPEWAQRAEAVGAGAQAERRRLAALPAGRARQILLARIAELEAFWARPQAPFTATGGPRAA